MTKISTNGIYLSMDTAKLFKSGRSQAVRLPKAFRFDGTQVFVKRMGSAVLLLPEAHPWELMVEACGEFSKDFMRERNQPKHQSRPAFGE